MLHLNAEKLEALGLGDMDIDDVAQALLTLGDAGYVAANQLHESGGGALYTGFRVTGGGLQAIGEWPWFLELTPATLAMLLEQLAEEAIDEQQAAAARSAATYVRKLGIDAVRSAAVAAGATLLRAGLRLA